MRRNNLTQALNILKIDKRVVKESLKDDGSGWVTLRCPFARINHKGGVDKHPSFGISVDPNGHSYYNCLSCGEKGKLVMLPHRLASKNLKKYDNLIETVSSIRSLEVEDALVIQSKVRQLKQFEPDPYEIYLMDNPMPDVREFKQARAYLKERSIPLHVADHMDLGYNKSDYRISFPIKWLDGRILGYSQRLALTKSQIALVHSKDPEYLRRLPKITNTEEINKDFCLLGLEHYVSGSKCVLVEGLFALARLNSLLLGKNYNLTPLAALGSSLKDNQIDLIASLFRSVILAFDNDNAGLSGMLKLKKALQSRGVIVSCIDWGATDKDDIDKFNLTDLVDCGIIKKLQSSNLVKNKLI